MTTESDVGMEYSTMSNKTSHMRVIFKIICIMAGEKVWDMKENSKMAFDKAGECTKAKQSLEIDPYFIKESGKMIILTELVF